MTVKWAALAAIGGVILLSGCAGTTQAASNSPSPMPTPTPTKQALADLLYRNYGTCNVIITEASDHGVVSGDDGHTVTLQTRNQYGNGSGLLDADEALCLLKMTGMPDSVKTEILQTRALDGMQRDSWGQYKASWTYHPDHGLNVVVSEQH
jgi:hypothetical protein